VFDLFAHGFRYTIIGTVIVAWILMAYVVIEEIVEWRKSK
jgi:hypothetical protein